MTTSERVKRVRDELAALAKEHGSLDPEVVVTWAHENADSALHSRFEWDDTKAGHQYRVWQARTIITEVTVTYEDGKKRQVYVSPIEQRGNGGYVPLVEVMGDKERRRRFLDQALAEYERLGVKYQDLKELSNVRAAVARVSGKKRMAA